MLETKNLTKIYKPKKGQPVKALDDVSLKLQDTGMVFLLGKSGSGKSTLLNLLGGLDSYTGGEIIIKGVSSRAFKQSHFDSYRNTYVGFIFQEYNILDEFTVGANIGLALELQGKKADSQTIGEILHEVDLDGYGQRKPNELSGGQKQRVAIARALVKKPEIIMADEPTGALDSNTGKQVFDTLKKLSKDKLVLIVSHDRDFAEQYADRIIELSDGKVISDVTIEHIEEEETPDKNGLAFSEDHVSIPSGYELTEEDRLAINEYLKNMKGERLTLSAKESKKRDLKITDTDQESIVCENAGGFRLIKSRLPMKNAFKIGASGLKYKKFRLVVTILLSVVAFTLFGLSDTFGAYDHIRTMTNSLIDSGVTFASVTKTLRYEDEDGEVWYQTGNYRFSRDDIDQIVKGTGLPFRGVYSPIGEESKGMLTGYDYDKARELASDGYFIYAERATGFAEVTESELVAQGYALEGKLPDSDTEVAIGKHLAETYVKFGYTDDINAEKPKFQTIRSASELIGKTLVLYGKTYSVSGIVDTNFDFDRYAVLMEDSEDDDMKEDILKYALASEYEYEINADLADVLFVSDGFIDRYIKANPYEKTMDFAYLTLSYETDEGFMDISFPSVMKMSDLTDEEIIWKDGKKRDTLGKKEIVVSLSAINWYGDATFVNEDGYPLIDKIISADISFDAFGMISGKHMEGDGWKLVGIIDDSKGGTEELYYDKGVAVLRDEYVDGMSQPEDWIYERLCAPMPESRQDVNKLVSFCYRDGTDMRYQLTNAVSFELDIANETLGLIAKVFFWIGIFFAIFASIMFANFIATSISHKKQEIGILRAIGSRSADVFRIFFSESFIIAMINFVLSVIGTAGTTLAINSGIRTATGLLITLLNFGIRQVILILLISLAVAFLASFFPTMRIAKKRPVDAIKSIG